MSFQFNRDSIDPANYRAYLIRLWRDGTAQTWRASVQPVAGGATVRFASLEALFDFLLSQTAPDIDDSPSMRFRKE